MEVHMKKIGILLAAIGLSALSGGATAVAQVRAIEKVQRYYSDSSYRDQTAELVFYCDGGFDTDGGMVTADYQEDYYGC
jgi:hypothetical protein